MKDFSPPYLDNHWQSRLARFAMKSRFQKLQPIGKLGLCVLICLSININLSAQKKGQTDPERQQLLQAQQYRKKDPARSIKIIESLLGGAKRKKQSDIEGEAYFLLGNIYEDIGQPDFASQRYKKALQFFQSTNQVENEAKTHSYLGKLELQSNELAGSEKYFQACVNLTKDKKLRTICLEGLADVAIAKKDFKKGKELNEDVREQQDLKNATPSDSLILSRSFAREAEILANQNQYEQAEELFNTSLESLPDKKLSKDDYARYKNVSEVIQSSNNNEQSSVQAEKNTDYYDFKFRASDGVVLEQLNLAEQSLESGSLAKASSFIYGIRSLDDSELSIQTKAKIAQVSANWNYQRGQFDSAMIEYRKFVNLNDSVLAMKEKENERMVDIIKNQGLIDLLEKDVENEQTQLELAENQNFTLKIVVGFLVLLLLTAIGAFYSIMKNVKARRRANQMLYLKSLRTQMNPHFIFNALNSVNNFISKNDERAANKFLADFSKLMRMVLDNSQKDFITLEEELQLIDRYLRLEHLRFRDKFEYTFEKPELLAQFDLKVPPMLIQPFVENAIWHGLRYKKEMGKLEVLIEESDHQILISIKDNGIGRTESQALKTDNQKKYKSTGLENVGKRIELINKLYGKGFEVSVEDLNSEKKETGTLVKITIPV